MKHKFILTFMLLTSTSWALPARNEWTHRREELAQLILRGRGEQAEFGQAWSRMSPPMRQAIFSLERAEKELRDEQLGHDQAIEELWSSPPVETGINEIFDELVLRLSDQLNVPSASLRRLAMRVPMLTLGSTANQLGLINFESKLGGLFSYALIRAADSFQKNDLASCRSYTRKALVVLLHAQLAAAKNIALGGPHSIGEDYLELLAASRGINTFWSRVRESVHEDLATKMLILPKREEQAQWYDKMTETLNLQFIANVPKELSNFKVNDLKVMESWVIPLIENLASEPLPDLFRKCEKLF